MRHNRPLGLGIPMIELHDASWKACPASENRALVLRPDPVAVRAYHLAFGDSTSRTSRDFKWHVPERANDLVFGSRWPARSRPRGAPR